MNLSGQSVAEAARFHKLALTDITVFHDEIDLAPGKLRVKTGGGHAGHNGLRSIHAHLGDAYHRVRLGVGHPGHKDAVPHYVLHDFAKADADWLDALLHGISDGAPALGAGDTGRFQNAVALRMARPSLPNPRPRPPLRLRHKRPPPEDTRSRFSGWRTVSAPPDPPFLLSKYSRGGPQAGARPPSPPTLAATSPLRASAPPATCVQGSHPCAKP